MKSLILALSVTHAHLIVSDHTFHDSFIQHLLIPFLEAFLFRNFLLRWMAMENIVVAFARRTCPNVSHRISAKINQLYIHSSKSSILLLTPAVSHTPNIPTKSRDTPAFVQFLA